MVEHSKNQDESQQEFSSRNLFPSEKISRRRFIEGSMVATTVFIAAGIAAIDSQTGLLTEARLDQVNGDADDFSLAENTVLEQILTGYAETNIHTEQDATNEDLLHLHLEKDGQLLLRFNGEYDPDVSMRLFEVTFQDRTIIVPLVQAKDFKWISVQLGIHSRGEYTCIVKEITPDDDESLRGVVEATPHEKPSIQGYTIEGTKIIEELLPPLIAIRKDNRSRTSFAKLLNDTVLYTRVLFKDAKQKNPKKALDSDIEEQIDIVLSSEDLDVSGEMERRPYDYERALKTFISPNSGIDEVDFQGRNHNDHIFSGNTVAGQKELILVEEYNAFDDNPEYIHDPSDSKDDHQYFSFAFNPSLSDAELNSRLNAYKIIGRKELTREGKKHMSKPMEIARKGVYRIATLFRR